MHGASQLIVSFIPGGVKDLPECNRLTVVQGHTFDGRCMYIWCIAQQGWLPILPHNVPSNVARRPRCCNTGFAPSQCRDRDFTRVISQIAVCAASLALRRGFGLQPSSSSGGEMRVGASRFVALRSWPLRSATAFSLNSAVLEFSLRYRLSIRASMHRHLTLLLGALSLPTYPLRRRVENVIDDDGVRQRVDFSALVEKVESDSGSAQIIIQLMERDLKQKGAEDGAMLRLAARLSTERFFVAFGGPRGANHKPEFAFVRRRVPARNG